MSAAAAGAVLITGASGLLGAWLRRTGPARVDVISMIHRRPLPGVTVEADLRDRRAVQAALKTVQPRLVIHAAFARDEASIVAASHHVAEAAQATGAALILISSDAVFSGNGDPSSESDEPDPVWDYGRWKTEAERVVLATDPKAAVVRLPLIVSLDPPDHVLEQISAAGSKGERTIWFTDEMRQPSWAEDLARGIWEIAALPREHRAGCWHLPGPERLSRFDIAVRGVEAAGLDRSWIVAETSPPDGRRPRDLHLAAERARREIGWSPRPAYRPARSGS